VYGPPRTSVSSLLNCLGTRLHGPTSSTLPKGISEIHLELEIFFNHVHVPSTNTQTIILQSMTVCFNTKRDSMTGNLTRPSSLCVRVGLARLNCGILDKQWLASKLDRSLRTPTHCFHLLNSSCDTKHLNKAFCW